MDEGVGTYTLRGALLMGMMSDPRASDGRVGVQAVKSHRAGPTVTENLRSDGEY